PAAGRPTEPPAPAAAIPLASFQCAPSARLKQVRAALENGLRLRGGQFELPALYPARDLLGGLLRLVAGARGFGREPIILAIPAQAQGKGEAPIAFEPSNAHLPAWRGELAHVLKLD